MNNKNTQQSITNIHQEFLKTIELNMYDDNLKTYRFFNRLRYLLIIISIVFLVFNIYNLTFGFWIWMFNLIFNSYFVFFRDRKQIKETKEKRMVILKEINEEQWLKELRLKKLKRINSIFY